MQISGFLPMLLAGLLGGALHEGLKAFSSIRSGKHLTLLDWIGSAVLTVLGGLVPLIYGLGPKPFLEVSQLAVAIPALISGGFRITTKDGSGNPSIAPESKRTVAEYLGWR